MSNPTETTQLLQRADEESNTHEVQKDVQGNDVGAASYHAPLLDHPDSAFQNARSYGPVSFLNRTRAIIDFSGGDNEPGEKEYMEWRSRRHTLIIPPSYTKSDSPPLSSSLSSIGKGIWRMCTVYAYWDVSWWIAVFFSVGCALFVVCGFFNWLPLAAPNTEFAGEELGGGVTAFIGATLFAFAGVLLVVEATNANQTGCFGWAIEQTWDQVRSNDDTAGESNQHADDEEYRVQRLAPSDCKHVAHANHGNTTRTWRWWPTWYELKTHYVHEIGFLASCILAIGTIIFLVSGVMSLPQVSKLVSQRGLLLSYWLAFLVGGFFFVTSSALYMLESQRRWYLPNLRSMGWWIGFWNLVGSVGWTLSASFGYCTEGWCTYQSHLSLLWASVAFLTGSLLLWYEALEKYPVERWSKFDEAWNIEAR